MLAGMDGDRGRSRQGMWIHRDRLGLVVAEHVLIDLFGLERLTHLVVAKEPKPGRPVVLVVCDGQVLRHQSS